jgi:tetratricopeptide (TPR) repeat protein
MSLGLVILTLITFLPVLRCGLVDFDDAAYVSENAHVLGGLTAANLHWAWTNIDVGYWQPLSWMSLMLDVTMHGPDPVAFHLTNLILHAFSAGVVFLVLYRMTGVLWRAALVAAIYAVHPLRVESVAWIAERKDVLSNLLAWLAVGGYVAYARAPSSKRYLLVLIPYVLGLLAKPMIVTLPFLLLLLDYWPLRRWRSSEIEHSFAPASLRQLIMEKVPLVILGLAAGSSALAGQSRVHAYITYAVYPLSHRVCNVLTAYVLYLWKMVWFSNLCVFYPLPTNVSAMGWIAGGLSALVLIAITVLAIKQIRSRPWLLVGWLWFVGVIFPVSGIFQSGQQLLADRFTYLAAVGLTVMVVWSIPEKTAEVPQWVRGVAAAALVAVLGASTWTQLGYWHDTRTLFTRALEVTQNNWIAHDQVALADYRDGDMDGARKEIRSSLAINPVDPVANMNMGILLSAKQQDAQAIPYFQNSLLVQPECAAAHNGLGVCLQHRGNFQEAYDHFARAVVLKPDYAAAHSNLGGLLGQIGMRDKAIVELRLAVKLDPDDQNTRKKYLYIMSSKGSAEATTLDPLNP